MMHQFVVTDQGACMPSSSKEVEPAIQMSLFPNPAHKEVFLAGRSDRISVVRIVDLSGKVLQQRSLPPFDRAVPISSSQLPKGYHFIQWKTVAGQKVLPFVVQ